MKVIDISQIKSFIQKFADDNGIELVDVEFKQGKTPSLTVYIDTEDGVDLDTCEFFHRLIDEPLDELDPTFGQPYTLNVSSPGLDRPLKEDRDFEKCLGEKVEFKVLAPIKGEKNFEGTLIDFDANTITVEINGNNMKIQRNQLAKINRAIEF